MKALAQHLGATQSLAEDDSLQLLFHIVAMNPSTSVDSSDGLKPTFSVAQLYRQALQVSFIPAYHLLIPAPLVLFVVNVFVLAQVQILGLLLNNDNGSSAQYIHKHQLVVFVKTQ